MDHSLNWELLISRFQIGCFPMDKDAESFDSAGTCHLAISASLGQG